MNIQVDALLRGAPGQEQAAKVEVRLFFLAQRVTRAFGGVLSLWLLGCGALFIPVLHFILCPLCALGGPILGVVLGRKKGVIETSELPCPACGAGMPVQGRSFRFPFYLQCPKCSQQIFVETKRAG